MSWSVIVIGMGKLGASMVTAMAAGGIRAIGVSLEESVAGGVAR